MTLFEFGSVSLRIDERGVGHMDTGWGNSIVARTKLRDALTEIIRRAHEALAALDDWERRSR